MALGLLGTLDLSLVTDRLVALLQDCYEAWPLWDTNHGRVRKFTTEISGSMPEAVRTKGNCQLSLYLLHVREDATQRNSPVLGRNLTIPFQPLSLNLCYLLTAFGAADYRQEQRAMSIALRCLYENPIVRMTIPIDGTDVHEEFTIQMQPESPDELSRIWQSFNAPFRLSAVYRASVIFVTPEAVTTQLAPHPERVVVAAEPASLPFAESGQVIGTLCTVRGFAPSSTAASPQVRTFDLSPAVVAAGDTFLLLGAGLGQATTARVYLLPASGPEQEVTTWINVDPARSTSAKLTLQIPTGAETPIAGVYQLRVGSDTAAGDPTTYRSNATPFSIAAKVGAPGNPPLLTPAAGLYTVTGAGFVADAMEVLLGTVALTETGSGTPAAGQFRIVNETTLTFHPPDTLAPGLYGVRIRTNGVESAPAWWVSVP